MADNKCENCGKPSEFKCSCGTKYCSKKCQIEDWNNIHKNIHPKININFIYTNIFKNFSKDFEIYNQYIKILIENPMKINGMSFRHLYKNLQEIHKNKNHDNIQFVNSISNNENQFVNAKNKKIHTSYIHIIVCDDNNISKIIKMNNILFDTGNLSHPTIETSEHILTNETVSIKSINDLSTEQMRTKDNIIVINIDNNIYLFFENLIVKNNTGKNENKILINSFIIALLNEFNIYIHCIK